MEKYRRNKGQVSRCPISVASHGSGLLAMVCDNMYKVLTAEEVDSGPSWFQLEKLTWVFTGGSVTQHAALTWMISATQIPAPRSKTVIHHKSFC